MRDTSEDREFAPLLVGRPRIPFFPRRNTANFLRSPSRYREFLPFLVGEPRIPCAIRRKTANPFPSSLENREFLPGPVGLPRISSVPRRKTANFFRACRISAHGFPFRRISANLVSFPIFPSEPAFFQSFSKDYRIFPNFLQDIRISCRISFHFREPGTPRPLGRHGPILPDNRPFPPSPSSPRHRAGPGFLEGRIFHPMISRGKIPPECSVSGKKSPSTSPHCRNFRRISPPGAGFAQKNLECPCLGRINP